MTRVLNQEEFNALDLEGQCNYMAEQAQAAADMGDYNNICLAGEAVFYVAADHGVCPGHIYSELGMDEFRISKSCEYHFDEWTAEPDEDEYYEV